MARGLKPSPARIVPLGAVAWELFQVLGVFVGGASLGFPE